MKRRAFLTLVGKVSAALATAPLVVNTKPTDHIFLFGERTIESSGFGLAPIKMEGSSVRYDSYAHMSKKAMKRALKKFAKRHSASDVNQLRDAMIARFG
jgi:hypothetical protein